MMMLWLVTGMLWAHYDDVYDVWIAWQPHFIALVDYQIEWPSPREAPTLVALLRPHDWAYGGSLGQANLHRSDFKKWKNGLRVNMLCEIMMFVKNRRKFVNGKHNESFDTSHNDTKLGNYVSNIKFLIIYYQF